MLEPTKETKIWNEKFIQIF